MYKALTPSRAREIAEILYEDRRDKLGYDELGHVARVADAARRSFVTPLLVDEAEASCARANISFPWRARSNGCVRTSNAPKRSSSGYVRPTRRGLTGRRCSPSTAHPVTGPWPRRDDRVAWYLP